MRDIMQLVFTPEGIRSMVDAKGLHVDEVRAYAQAHWRLEGGYWVWGPVAPGKATPGHRVGHDMGRGWRKVGIHGAQLRMGRVVWALHYGWWPQGQIDHINQVKDDDRVENLRDVTAAENMRNRAYVPNTSGVAGVHWHTLSQRWRAKISVNGKQKYLGQFDNLFDARLCWLKARDREGYHSNHGTKV